MQTIRCVVLFLIGVTLFSCYPKNDLKSDKHLAEIFTDNELKEIEKMISYVDDRVVEQIGNRDINEAYHQLLTKIDQTMQDSSQFFVPFDEEEKYEFLESLDSTVFNEFWTFRHARKAVYQDSIYEDAYQSLELSINGRYVSDYLERIGKEDEYYKSVRETLKMAWGFSPTIAAWFLKNHDEFDFTLPKNRLWAVIYLLRIEEHHDKKMERYLNKKSLD